MTEESGDRPAAPPRAAETQDLATALASGKVQTNPHIKWRFWVLSGALTVALLGSFSPWTPAEARSGGFAIAGSIITAFAKPLEGMGP